ncbi:hypothetical protein B0T19DRAFT_488480 [Cercophora scortea]|uniref:Uncharacterized protein n=1 Tax=Cercophora scortea TaxID=314031 RepID=A0AAE0I8P5_9PEZI|nr:hypothetical protein B0T19DRAFT_488480 [Cercophora scortea]
MMDWPAVLQPFLDDDTLGLFSYDTPSDFPCRVVQGNETKLDVYDVQPPTRSLSGRVQPAKVDSTQADPEGTFTRGLYYLPFSLPIWARITKTFHFHNVIYNALIRNKCYSTYLTIQKCGETQALDMYTAVASSDLKWFGTIGISSTYFRDLKLTAAAIYGCDEGQMERVEALLRASPEVRSHPLLMVGVFAELQRDRLEEMVDGVIAESDAIVMSLPVDSKSTERAGKKKEFSRNLNRRLRQCRVDIKEVEEELKSTKAQLRKMIQEIENITATKTKPGDDYSASGHSTGSKNEAMSGAEKEERSEASSWKGKQVAVAVDDTKPSGESQAYEPLPEDSHEHEEQGAVLNTAQAKASRVIAFVAMLYLPMTTVATIFAMPVFNFQSHWLDDHFNFCFSSNSSSATNVPNLVLSAYFYWYLVTSLVLTGFTLICWYYYTRDIGRDNDDTNSDDNHAAGNGSFLSLFKPKYWSFEIRRGMSQGEVKQNKRAAPY